ncbi:acyl-CoA/acyl-ACP dehydrogenase [Pseudoalteromonas sp. MMG013]|uniref:acyl-CoA dehydrogenase family protein n=1 Tax=Pseudoalteromonas sp. MMG013 TaxID=2822687 RepID=UPI001B36873B|nr:acyl-CoA dehydrogenase family protein [Pseudoalteromonas sp. MMG013]MBQ4863672.1 acyl-CoA/acyl-ACP dehydrogenase [Pseudoalteromonas sp. MMG013]
MNFNFTEKQQRVADQAKMIAQTLNLDDLTQRDLAGTFSKPLFRQLINQGIGNWLLPISMKGDNLNALELTAGIESLAEHCEDSGLIFALSAHLCACVHPIRAFASDQQQAQWLPKITSEAWLGTHAITEPQAGSDIYAMTTRAERTTQGFVLNGHKEYITNAPAADFVVVHLRTEDRDNYFDYSTFILDAHECGVSISKTPHNKSGLRTTAMGDIYFDNCLLPESALIGRLGAGAPIFQVSMEWERVCLFALYLGQMKRQLQKTARYISERNQFDAPLSSYQSVQHQLCDMYLNYESSRLLLYKAAWSLDKGDVSGVASSLAKITVSQSAISNGQTAVQLHGAKGVLSGDIERMLRDAMPSAIFSGTTNVLKNNISNTLIKRLKAQWI